MIFDIQKIKKLTPQMLVYGNHKKIIQSILDYDYLSGKDKPSIIGIIAQGRRSERLFFGNEETMIPVYENVNSLASNKKKTVNLLLNLSSGRRALSSTKSTIEHAPNLAGVTIFAESVPERHSLELIKISQKKKIWIIGPASVGMIIPEMLKFGAIGGIEHRQIKNSNLLHRGNVAVLSSSGGMTNEMMNVVTRAGLRISFSLSFGGERFPILGTEESMLAAQKDPSTEHIVYFGELGGDDEYRIIKLVEKKLLTKPIIAYIAGSVADLFDQQPQFGHAKSMAQSEDETARVKRKAMNQAGITAPEKFEDFIAKISKLSSKNSKSSKKSDQREILTRNKSLFVSSISSVNESGDLLVVGEKLEDLADHSLGEVIGMLLLGKPKISKDLARIIELIFKLLADHGPHVSGAMNTMISARAGKDLVSSLASGLLTVGPRFGGAINDSAREILNAVTNEEPAIDFVERFAREGRRIPGIGHRKYRIDFPDPRIARLLEEVKKPGKYTKFGLEVQEITVKKSGNLILNVDGTIAAVLLDLLSTKEGLDSRQLQQLSEIEFFNSLFVLARSIGFTAHFLDQKRTDEGLLRLSDGDVATVGNFYFEE